VGFLLGLAILRERNRVAVSKKEKKIGKKLAKLEKKKKKEKPASTKPRKIKV
jgi:hypothetical protein